MSEGRIAASPPLPGHRLGHQLVRADAGAGKTYSLAVRYLALVAAGAAPEKILAATFTRKAAGEILERILLRLARAALDPASAEGLARDLGSAVEPVRARRFAELLAGLCAGLHRVQVGTLDAFFHRVTTAFRLELGIPTVTTVAAAGDPGLAPLRLAAVERALGELAAEGEDALVELLGRLYRGDAARSVASALDRVVLEVYETFRLAPELSAWRRLEIPHSRLGEEELRAAVERLGDEAAGFDGALLEALSKDHAQARRGDWLGFLVDGPAAKIAEDPQQPSYRRRPLPKSLVRAYAPLVEHARWDLLERLARQTEATHRLVAAFDRHFERLRRARGVVLFSDFSRLLTHHFARLGEEALLGLFYRLDARVEHLLLDEFQDTSREQWLALAWLAEEILAWGDGSRTMFCVGDPKQSIYGWRGGCAELFDLVESRLLGDHRAAFGGGRDDELGGGLEDGPGSGSEGGLEDGSGPGSEGGLEGRPIGAGSVAPATVVSALERSAPLRRLGVSFRSSPVVLAAVDAVFARLAHNRALAEGPPREEAARWVARYQRHEAAVPERPGWVRLITSGEWEGEFPPDAPPGAIDPEGEEADQEEAAEAQRPVGHLAFVADRVAEIAARSQPNSPGGDRGQVPNSEGGDGYLSPISVGVLTLTNRTAAELLALLRERGVEASGEGGGPLIDDPAVTAALSALWLAAHPGDSAAAFHVARSPLGGVLGLDDFRSPEDVSRRVRSELLERGTPSVLAEWARALQPATSRRSGARLAQLVELAETHEREGLGGPFDLVARARAATLEEPSPAPVRVMTVHRAKGLEFDVVVLPELERRLGDLNNPLILLDRPAAIAPIAALFRGTNQTVRSCSEQLTAVHAQEVARRVADDLGVLYVALTRARHELLLVVQPVASSKSGRRTFAELLRHALAEAGRDRW
ncbi:MAG TPA: UvrD-helicase domain-containing protein, partial [Thermoanaerobaculia bacterium]|nr:UvrD-helicase domain-containing protein [Thermoanaerobaculia bacterium]